MLMNINDVDSKKCVNENLIMQKGMKFEGSGKLGLISLLNLANQQILTYLQQFNFTNLNQPAMLD